MDQFLGDVVKLPVAGLAGPGQQQESPFTRDLVTLHQNALGLPNHVAPDHSSGEVGLLPDTGVGDGGMRVEEETDLLRVSVNASGSGRKGSAPQVVALDIQLQGQHARRTRLAGRCANSGHRFSVAKLPTRTVCWL
jgi:hypothetical protein